MAEIIPVQVLVLWNDIFSHVIQASFCYETFSEEGATERG